MAKKTMKIVVLQVRATRRSYRRAGIQFGSKAVNIPIADLKKEEIAAIKDDPHLFAVETEVDAEVAD